jgi:hypothetical protein
MNLAAVRRSAPELDALVRLLADLERPASAAGVLLTLNLLTLPSSPLYDGSRGTELAAAASAIIGCVESADSAVHVDVEG